MEHHDPIPVRFEASVLDGFLKLDVFAAGLDFHSIYKLPERKLESAAPPAEIIRQGLFFEGDPLFTFESWKWIGDPAEIPTVPLKLVEAMRCEALDEYEEAILGETPRDPRCKQSPGDFTM